MSSAVGKEQRVVKGLTIYLLPLEVLITAYLIKREFGVPPISQTPTWNSYQLSNKIIFMISSRRVLKKIEGCKLGFSQF